MQADTLAGSSSLPCWVGLLQDGRDTESMKLLKNILPESIIERMQSGQKFVADSHPHVVIMFSGGARGATHAHARQYAAPEQ